MKSLQQICEGILNGLDNDIEDYVEVRDRMEKDLKWVKQIKPVDAVYYEAAWFNITRDAFRKAHRSDAEFKRLLAIFMVAACLPYVCYNTDDGIDNWEERLYSKREFWPDDADTDILHATPDDYRWNWIGSGSFYDFFWDGDYIHSLDQEELLTNKKTQNFSKKLRNIAAKHGLKLKPIF